MTEDKKAPETVEDQDLDQANGGYSVWIGGSVQDDNTVKPEYQVRPDPTIDGSNTFQGSHGRDTLIFPKKGN